MDAVHVRPEVVEDVEAELAATSAEDTVFQRETTEATAKRIEAVGGHFKLGSRYKTKSPWSQDRGLSGGPKWTLSELYSSSHLLISRGLSHNWSPWYDKDPIFPT